MKYRKVGDTGLEISEISIGTFPFDQELWGEITEEDAIKILVAAYEKGVNYFNSAWYYGKGRCEVILGKSVRHMDRDKVFISTKVGTEFRDLGQSPKGIQKSVESILKRMDLEYIDFLLLHFPDKDTPIEKSIEYLNKLKEKGVVRLIGLSQHSLEEIKKARKTGEIEVLEYYFSLLTQNMNKEILEYAAENNIATTVFKVIERGVLTNDFLSEKQDEIIKQNLQYDMEYVKPEKLAKTEELVKKLKEIAYGLNMTVAQLSIAWALRQGGVTSALIGARSLEQLEENLKAINIKLHQEVEEDLDSLISNIFNN